MTIYLVILDTPTTRQYLIAHPAGERPQWSLDSWRAQPFEFISVAQIAAWAADPHASVLVTTAPE